MGVSKPEAMVYMTSIERCSAQGRRTNQVRLLEPVIVRSCRFNATLRAKLTVGATILNCGDVRRRLVPLDSRSSTVERRHCWWLQVRILPRVFQSAILRLDKTCKFAAKMTIFFDMSGMRTLF